MTELETVKFSRWPPETRRVCADCAPKLHAQFEEERVTEERRETALQRDRERRAAAWDAALRDSWTEYQDAAGHQVHRWNTVGRRSVYVELQGAAGIALVQWDTKLDEVRIKRAALDASPHLLAAALAEILRVRSGAGPP